MIARSLGTPLEEVAVPLMLTFMAARFLLALCRRALSGLFRMWESRIVWTIVLLIAAASVFHLPYARAYIAFQIGPRYEIGPTVRRSGLLTQPMVIECQFDL